jgi:hypothetical protein
MFEDRYFSLDYEEISSQYDSLGNSDKRSDFRNNFVGSHNPDFQEMDQKVQNHDKSRNKDEYIKKQMNNSHDYDSWGSGGKFFILLYFISCFCKYILKIVF